jgi:hypothetical protein
VGKLQNLLQSPRNLLKFLSHYRGIQRIQQGANRMIYIKVLILAKIVRTKLKLTVLGCVIKKLCCYSHESSRVQFLSFHFVIQEDDTFTFLDAR